MCMPARSLPAVPSRTDPKAAERQATATRAIPVAAPPTLDWERTTWVSAASQVVGLMAFGLSMPFLPLYVQVLGVEDRASVALWSGIIAGSAAIPMALMAPVWGALADRYGRKAMLVRSLLGGAALVAAMGFVGDVWQLLVLRLLQGGVTGSQSAASALVAAAAPARHVGFALGLVNTAVQLGNSIGPALGGLMVGGLGFRGSFVLGGILLALGGFMVLFWVDEPPDGRRLASRSRTRDPDGEGNWLARMLTPFTWPRFRTVLLLQLGTQFAFAATFALLPIYLQEMARPDWLSAELASGLSVTLTAVAAAAVMPVAWRVCFRS
jgi:MFS family permease